MDGKVEAREEEGRVAAGREPLVGEEGGEVVGKVEGGVEVDVEEEGFIRAGGIRWRWMMLAVMVFGELSLST